MVMKKRVFRIRGIGPRGRKIDNLFVTRAPISIIKATKKRQTKVAKIKRSSIKQITKTQARKLVKKAGRKMIRRGKFGRFAVRGIDLRKKK